jgi:hypothetical protein
MPLNRPAVSASARIAWTRAAAQEEETFSVGLTYEMVDPSGQQRIIRYAWTKRLFAPAIISLILILAVGIGFNGYVNMKLVEGNRQLVKQLLQILRESNTAKNKIKQINREKDELQLNIQALQLRIQTIGDEKKLLAEKVKQEEVRAAGRVSELNGMIDTLTRDKAAFQEQLIALQHKESVVTEELLRLDQKKTVLEQANFDRMYKWLTVHQNPRTGLVMSFEGDKDVKGWAFIYDQALVAQTHIFFSDFERARKILDFFVKKAKRSNGLFVNAYYVNDGAPAEYIVHSGPNLWVGMALAHYVRKAQDAKYLVLAEEIARKIMELQAQDPEGGVRGGPDVSWFATEHNLDAYAFFNMLYKLTGKPVYLDARNKVLDWLMRHSYDESEIPIKRGKGDSTIATDTYAWSIAALGPEKLSELGMNPDKIVEFAEENCAVTIEQALSGKEKVSIRGFDFAPQRHVARGGIISTEWTAQMVLSLRIMAAYYHRQNMTSKAQLYESKADEYLADLCTMIISSPSPTGQGEGCLPYASQEVVDTGHGWMTPQGKSTGSVSGTAYTIFAYYNYNPLVFKE